MFALVPSGGGGLGGAVHAAVAGIWMLGYAAAAFGQRGERRGTLLAASGIVATWVAVLAAHSWPNTVPAACAVVAIATAWMSRREKLPDIPVATLVAGCVGFAHGMLRLVDVPGFGVPLATGPSAALAAGVAGLAVAARLLPEFAESTSETGISLRTIAHVLLASACFVWWRAELARAFSADASTFLLILYYATSGVVVLWRGRVAGSRRLRQAGLALSVWAAISAIGGAFTVQQIGLRVGSYLAVGAFLLGVAWWYRALPEGREGDA
jgi:hypothetical protein